jgi:hypothetical protein
LWYEMQFQTSDKCPQPLSQIDPQLVCIDKQPWGLRSRPSQIVVLGWDRTQALKEAMDLHLSSLVIGHMRRVPGVAAGEMKTKGVEGFERVELKAGVVH